MQKITHNCFFPWWLNNEKRKNLLLLQMSKWRFRQMWIWARQNHQKGMSILRMIKFMAESMRRMKFLKSCFFPISKKIHTLKSLFFLISKKVHTLPYIHHLRPVNCFIFVKFWAVKQQQHLSLMLIIIYTVLQGMKYIRADYLEKVKEKKEPCPL